MTFNLSTDVLLITFDLCSAKRDLMSTHAWTYQKHTHMRINTQTNKHTHTHTHTHRKRNTVRESSLQPQCHYRNIPHKHTETTHHTPPYTQTRARNHAHTHLHTHTRHHTHTHTSAHTHTHTHIC